MYVPSTEGDKPVSTREFNRRINETVRYFTKRYDGTTRVSAYGTWYDSSRGKVVKEKIAKVEVFIDEPVWRKNKHAIFKWLRTRPGKWKQSALMFEHNLQSTLISKPKPRPKTKKTTMFGRVISRY